MTQYVFATGDLFSLPVDGGAPFKFGALQDVSVDFSADIKQLFGQYQFALDVARGKTKIEGKAATGQVSASAFNTFYFNQTVTEGEQMLRAINESHAVPTGATFAATHTGANFFQDLGLYDSVTGDQLQQVPSGPSGASEYSVSATGVYTLGTGPRANPVLANYLYEDANGQRLDIGNPLMGDTPKFRMVLSQTYNQKTFTLVLYSCTAEKLSLPLKQDDYLIADLTFQAQANDANQVGFMTTTG